jgi:hypothetical protein
VNRFNRAFAYVDKAFSMADKAFIEADRAFNELDGAAKPASATGTHKALFKARTKRERFRFAKKFILMGLQMLLRGSTELRFKDRNSIKNAIRNN